MSALFLRILDMSVSAGILAGAVILLRLLLRKAPKYIHCILWAMVALRLIVPTLPSSPVSLLPDGQPVSSIIAAESQDAPVFNVLPPVQQSQTPSAPQPETPERTNWLDVLSVIWLAGIGIMAAYGMVSYGLLRRRVAAAVREGEYWLCDRVSSPFILGVIRPRIYLPSGMSEAHRDSVLAHEKAHLCRKDHWWKPLGFVLLAVHWFNPVMWLGYVLLCRDIEAACDERVVKNMEPEQRKRYSEALLECAMPRRSVAACPLAFGEQSVKSRIRSVLSYKKPTVWIILAAMVAAIILGVCFLTDPLKPEPPATEPSGSGSDATEPTQGFIVMPAQVAISRPAAFAVEDNCFYAYDTNGILFLVRWNDTSRLQEGRTVTVTFSEKIELENSGDSSDGGFDPQYEITALEIDYNTPPGATGPNDPLQPESLLPYTNDAYLRNLADEAIKKKYSLKDLGDYQISVSRNVDNTSATVKYELTIFGYRTYESYSVRFGSDATIDKIYGDYGKYARYLPYATRAAYDKAKEKLDQQLKPYPENSGYYLTIDREGYLCLAAEVIRMLQTPVTGPDGTLVGGCGYDHEHLFFTERICYYE